ncbi:hypothetical protein MSG28_010370 [Choristoneura fumiferana]|uniref:Uncharacterized protein n=1 Tax=Choristoneura fumiferana TaxID=7141 RepID=A0ACC0KKJ3_CHOFU|nr:hypothetical protein MSG28_010370 [Choristoneura fumiferana]
MSPDESEPLSCVAESFKKTRPTNYIGPGHYKPTKRGGLPVNPPNKPGKLAGAYKKTRPTNYLGPGHFKPTTKNSGHKNELKHQASIAFNNSEVNATSNLEPIVVNVTKTHDKSAPFVLNTKMYQNQLLPGLIRRPALQTTLALVTTNQLPGTLDIRMSLNVGGIVTESGPKVRYKSLKFSKSYTNRQMTYHIGPQLKSFRLM